MKTGNRTEKGNGKTEERLLKGHRVRLSANEVVTWVLLITSMTRALTASVSLTVSPLPGSSTETSFCASELSPKDEEGVRRTRESVARENRTIISRVRELPLTVAEIHVAVTRYSLTEVTANREDPCIFPSPASSMPMITIKHGYYLYTIIKMNIRM